MAQMTKARLRESNIQEEVRFIQDHLSGKCDCWYANLNGVQIAQADYAHLVREYARYGDHRLQLLVGQMPGFAQKGAIYDPPPHLDPSRR